MDTLSRVRVSLYYGITLSTAYTPEFNPIERLRQDIKEKLFQNVFTSLQEMQDNLTEIIRSYTKITIESITKYDYIAKIENVI